MSDTRSSDADGLTEAELRYMIDWRHIVKDGEVVTRQVAVSYNVSPERTMDECERCGGAGRSQEQSYPEDCPACGGHGWAIEEVE